MGTVGHGDGKRIERRDARIEVAWNVACEKKGAPVTLGGGFGVIFEWIPLEARLEIARRVALVA